MDEMKEQFPIAIILLEKYKYQKHLNYLTQKINLRINYEQRETLFSPHKSK
jgi:hypothetical protein